MRFILDASTLPTSVVTEPYIELPLVGAESVRTTTEAGEEVDAVVGDACHWQDIVAGIFFLMLVVTGIVVILLI
jgi:hypothetical protein